MLLLLLCHYQTFVRFPNAQFRSHFVPKPHLSVRRSCTKVDAYDQKLYQLYRCPKFDGDAKQTLEIRVERKKNWKLGELGEVSFRMLKLGELGEMSFGIYKLGWLGEVRFGMLKLGELGEVSFGIYKLCG